MARSALRETQKRERLRSEAATSLEEVGVGGGFTVKHACTFLLFTFPAFEITKATLFCNWH